MNLINEMLSNKSPKTWIQLEQLPAERPNCDCLMSVIQYNQQHQGKGDRKTAERKMGKHRVYTKAATGCVRE
jgi:hypothetical protein